MGIFRSLRGALGGDQDKTLTEAEKERVETVRNALAYGDVEARWNAIRAAGELGDAFIDPLITALNDEHWIIRRGAAQTLAKIGAPAVPPLIEMLGCDDESVRREVVRAFILIGETAVESLIRALSRDQPAIRQGAAQILGEMGVQSAVGPLVEALKDKDPGVRREAAIALKLIGHPDAVGPLIDLLGDESGFVRIAAADALCSLEARSIEPLIAALANTRTEIRQRAGLALAAIGSPAVDPLVAALGHEDPLIRQGAAGVLGRIGDSRAVPGLIRLLGDPVRKVRQESVKALSMLGYPAISSLVSAFREGDMVARNCAMEALWLIGGPAVRPLIDLLDDQSPDVRRRTALLLGEMGDPGAIEALTRVLGDPVPVVRREAFEALEKIRKGRQEESGSPRKPEKGGEASSPPSGAGKKKGDTL